MEYHSELKSNPRDQQSLRTSGKPILPQASQSIKLRDRLKPEKHNLSYSDLHHEITTDAKDSPSKSSGNLQKQWSDRKVTKEDELVKYMSNLPSYLERGENLQDKVLNVGVLDWGRLEKWRYNHKQVPCERSQYSPSSSNTSSAFSTDGSSAPSSRGHSRSPAHPRARRPSLQSHLMASSIEGHSQDVKSFGGSIGKFQDLQPAQSNTFNGQGKFVRTDQPFCDPVIKLKQNKRKDSNPKIDQVSGVIPNDLNNEAASCTKVKIKTQDGEFLKRAEKLQEPNSKTSNQDVPGKRKTVVVLLPRDLSRNNHSGAESSDLTTLLSRRSVEASRRSFSEIYKDIFHAELHSDIPHSCPLPCEVESKHSQIKQPGSIDAESVKFSSGTTQPVPRSAKVGLSPSRSRTFENKKSTLMPTNLAVKEPLKGLDLKVSNVTAEKVRSSSPLRRLSIGLGKMSKIYSSKEGLDIPQPISMCIPARSGSENSGASACLDTSNAEKLNATGRARSSPLRRLLDPLLKPKATNCSHFAEPLQGDSTSINRAGKSSDERLASSNVHSGKVKLDMTVQALLRVAVKNGQPLFIFADGNDSDFLAATVKKLSTSRKDDYCLIYTFLTIRVVKKKRGKGKGHDYISNVVAQMKVYESQFSKLIREHCMGQFSERKFVLFSVDLRQAEQQTSDFQPNDELAAIVVEIPKGINRSSIRDGCQSNNYNDLISTKVILPSGVHSLPSKGGPSSLIERWKSDGLCDCGGWDLGCKLRILDNRNHVNKKLGSSKACSIPDQFELFSQDGVQVKQPYFSLAPYRDGIYSVDFDSSLSVLQAFSICIAVLDSKKLCELSESSDSFEEKTSEETISLQKDGIRASSRIEEFLAEYGSNPPISPVGRA